MTAQSTTPNCVSKEFNMTRAENDAALAAMYERNGLTSFADAFSSQELPVCQKCGAEDSMEHHKVRVPDAPLDADWDECVVCGYRTTPE